MFHKWCAFPYTRLKLILSKVSFFCLFACSLVCVVVVSLLCKQKRYSHNKFFFMFIYNDATLLYYRDLYYTFPTLSLFLSTSLCLSLNYNQTMFAAWQRWEQNKTRKKHIFRLNSSVYLHIVLGVQSTLASNSNSKRHLNRLPHISPLLIFLARGLLFFT